MLFQVEISLNPLKSILQAWKYEWMSDVDISYILKYSYDIDKAITNHMFYSGDLRY
jgi:hypothetical protein